MARFTESSPFQPCDVFPENTASARHRAVWACFGGLLKVYLFFSSFTRPKAWTFGGAEVQHPPFRITCPASSFVPRAKPEPQVRSHAPVPIFFARFCVAQRLQGPGRRSPASCNCGRIRGGAHRCLFSLFWLKNRGRSLVYLVFPSSTRETHAISP